jgi:hypothetical protein
VKHHQLIFRRSIFVLLIVSLSDNPIVDLVPLSATLETNTSLVTLKFFLFICSISKLKFKVSRRLDNKQIYNAHKMDVQLFTASLTTSSTRFARCLQFVPVSFAKNKIQRGPADNKVFRNTSAAVEVWQRVCICVIFMCLTKKSGKMFAGAVLVGAALKSNTVLAKLECVFHLPLFFPFF